MLRFFKPSQAARDPNNSPQKRKMILTTCAACAAPLAHNAPRCVRCQTRYCNKTCQHDHWRRGHKQLCKKIHRGGNAEQYHADKKYKEAVAVAVEVCADDTKGQTCYICTEALHWKTKEGLVRMCACRGTAGFAHVSCLAEQAKILLDEAEANNLDTNAKYQRLNRWHRCSLCEQSYHGVVQCALGWACWKTYCGRPQPNLPPPAGDLVPDAAITVLARGLTEGGHHDESIAVLKGQLAAAMRRGHPEWPTLDSIESNLANSYIRGRRDELLPLRRRIYARRLRLFGVYHGHSIHAAVSLSSTLCGQGLYAEARSLLLTHIPRSVLKMDYNGPGMGDYHKVNVIYAGTFLEDKDASMEEVREAVTLFEGAYEWYKRNLGPEHPRTVNTLGTLETAREKLAGDPRWW